MLETALVIDFKISEVFSLLILCETHASGDFGDINLLLPCVLLQDLR
jgi:hypothetical protein